MREARRGQRARAVGRRRRASASVGVSEVEMARSSAKARCPHAAPMTMPVLSKPPQFLEVERWQTRQHGGKLR
jgi:hypothetical protein